MTSEGLALESIKSLEWELTDIVARLILQYLWSRDEEGVKQLSTLYFDIRLALENVGEPGS